MPARRIVKQDNVPDRSPFLRLSNNRTLQQQTLLGSHATFYPDGSLPYPSGSTRQTQSQKAAARLDRNTRHSFHHGARQQAPQLSRPSLSLSRTQATGLDTNVDAHIPALENEGFYPDVDLPSHQSLKKEPDSSPLHLDADKYERLLDTEPLGRDNDALYSEHARGSSVGSLKHQETTFAEGLQRSQSKASHVSEAAEATSNISHWMAQIPAEFERVKIALEEKVSARRMSFYYC